MSDSNLALRTSNLDAVEALEVAVPTSMHTANTTERTFCGCIWVMGSQNHLTKTVKQRGSVVPVPSMSCGRALVTSCWYCSALLLFSLANCVVADSCCCSAAVGLKRWWDFTHCMNGSHILLAVEMDECTRLSVAFLGFCLVGSWFLS